MALKLENLEDEGVRAAMLAEFDSDNAGEGVYKSTRMTILNYQRYIPILRDALEQHDEEWLAFSIRTLFSAVEDNGKNGTKKVPHNANETLAEDQFNRYYIRGLCRTIVEAGDGQVMVYRAKAVRDPRPDSELKLGRMFDASHVLAELRKTSIRSVDAAFGVPNGPNSGISVRRA